jgi:hypothetical protein
VPLLVGSDDPTNLAELLIPQRLCVAGRVPVGDKGGPLLEGGVQEAQVRVVLSLGVLSRGALLVSLKLASVLGNGSVSILESSFRAGYSQACKSGLRSAWGPNKSSIAV